MLSHVDVNFKTTGYTSEHTTASILSWALNHDNWLLVIPINILFTEIMSILHPNRRNSQEQATKKLFSTSLVVMGNKNKQTQVYFTFVAYPAPEKLHYKQQSSLKALKLNDQDLQRWVVPTDSPLMIFISEVQISKYS